MRQSTLAYLALPLALLSWTSPPRAQADTFAFTFAGSVYSGSGQLTGSLTTGPNPTVATYLITAVAGTATYNAEALTIPITGIASQGTGAQVNDNLLFYPAVNGIDFFDGSGLAFNLGNGVNINLFAYSGIYETLPTGGILQDSGPIQVTATPEASSLTLFLLPAITLFAWQTNKRQQRTPARPSSL